MRSIALVILTASCGGGQPPAKLPTKPISTDTPGCPEDSILIPKFRPLYASSVGDGTAQYTDALEINIVSCQWGNWAGPSFLVHHSIPEQPNQEVGSLGGTAIVRADGTIVASRFGDGTQSVTVEGHDLDGDGNDEIFETTSFDGRGMAPISGSAFSISRVVGKDIVSLDLITSQLSTSGMEPAESCETKVEFLPVGAAKHLVITAKRIGEQFASQCLANGRHEFVLDHGKLEDLSRAPD